MYFTWTEGFGHLSVPVFQQQAQEKEPSTPLLSLETTWLFMVGIQKMSFIAYVCNICTASVLSVVLRETPAAYSRVQLIYVKTRLLPTVITGSAYI